LIASGQKDRAIDVLQQALKFYPKDDLGYAYIQADKQTEAQEALDIALASNPEHAETYNLRGLGV
jgi:tetratricopeptide (TPR) repeat protein